MSVESHSFSIIPVECMPFFKSWQLLPECDWNCLTSIFVFLWRLVNIGKQQNWIKWQCWCTQSFAKFWFPYGDDDGNCVCDFRWMSKQMILYELNDQIFCLSTFLQTNKQTAIFLDKNMKKADSTIDFRFSSFFIDVKFELKVQNDRWISDWS